MLLQGPDLDCCAQCKVRHFAEKTARNGMAERQLLGGGLRRIPAGSELIVPWMQEGSGGISKNQGRRTVRFHIDYDQKKLFSPSGTDT